MRRYLLLLSLITLFSCAVDPTLYNNLVQDRQAYIDYRSFDLDSFTRDDEEVWELEWFQSLTVEQQHYVVDSLSGFSRLAPYIDSLEEEL